MDLPPNPERTRLAPRAGPRAALAVAALLGIAIAAVIYVPWQPRPFDILDFSEFVPLLRTHPGVVGGTIALAHYYGEAMGRFNLVSYFGIAARWNLLGAHPIAWQWLRFAEMLLLVAGVWKLARSLGSDRVGAAIAGSLFVLGQTAPEAWLRATVGEPLGLLLLIAAALIGAEYNATERWRLRGALIGLLWAAALLTKEMLIGTLPLLLVVTAGRQPDGRLGHVVRWERTRWLIVCLGCASAIIGAGVIAVALGSPASSFVRSYGVTGAGPSRLLAIALTILVPAQPQSSFGRWGHPADFLFLLITLVGTAVALLEARQRAHGILLASLGCGLPLLGAALYLPWPYFNHFYGLPFALGPAIWLADCITTLRTRPALRAGTIVAAAALPLFLVSDTSRFAGSTRARQELNGAIAAELPRLPQVDSIIVFEPFLPQQPWQGTGPTLARFARAMQLTDSLPPAVDLPCGRAGEALDRPKERNAFITYSDRCGLFQAPSRRLRASYRTLNWGGIRTETIDADVLIRSLPSGS